jgi:acetolactate synthase I/II/III large subunit
MLVSDYILHFLEKKGVKNVFLITGGAISFVVDAFSRNKKIKYTCVGHEQAAAMMADSYSRMGPNYSATMVTSGPGATNLLTGIACSWFDSIPSIHICGQVNLSELSNYNKNTKNVRQVGFQETDIVSMAKPITKFAYQLKSYKDIRYALEKSYYISQEGRPGPVLIDIPMNLQRIDINPKKLRSFKSNIIIKPKNILKKKIALLQRLLSKSSRPCLIIGGGIRISKTTKELKNLVNKLNIPALSTWSGVDALSHDNKNYIGCLGVYGSRSANFVVQNSDLVISLGSRLDTRITGGDPKSFARKAKVISVDVDPNELNKNRGLKIDLKINSDLSNFFKEINKINNFKIKDIEKWNIKALQWKNKYPIVSQKYREQKNFVNPYVFMEKLSKLLKNDDILVADDGAHLTWAIQGLKIKKNQRLFSAFGNSPMGYAFPAAIGASIAKNKKKIICIDGDGSIQMNIQEMHTMISNKLPIKIIIMNNNGYGIIKQFQKLYLNSRFEATGKGLSNPNFKKIAYSYGVSYSIIKKNNEINKVLRKKLNSNKAEFIDIMIEPNQKIIPKLTFGDAIENLSPKLPKKEFLNNMLVETVKPSKKLIESN